MMSIAAPEQLPGFTSSVCLTPNVVIDAGEIYVIVDAFTGVVGNKYISGIDQLVADISLAGNR